jgi:hypothetical protein
MVAAWDRSAPFRGVDSLFLSLNKENFGWLIWLFARHLLAVPWLFAGCCSRTASMVASV